MHNRRELWPHWQGCEGSGRWPTGPTSVASKQDFAQNCFEPRSSHRDRAPIPLEHSKRQRCPIDPPILHRETNSVVESSRRLGNRPGPSLRLQENATLLPVLLSVRRQPCAEWFPAEYVPRSGVPACPRIETGPRRDADPSLDRGSQTTSQERT